MKKLNIFALFLLMMTAFTGCKEESITLTSELPQFETRDGLMLLEVIVPYGTGINDQIYIMGDFNGGMDAVGDPQWLLQRGNPQSGVPAKFGIYLNPNDFQNGKTLADGYTFYNIQSGPERNIENGDMLHYDFPATGQRLNVFVDYWENDFLEPENPDDVEHDGYAIYVINNTGWVELALYAWGNDLPELFGGWPGVTPTGKIDINGTVYQYFDTGASNEGLNYNLIFNNNGGGNQLPDFNVTLNKDYYFELNPEGVVEIDPDASTPHDGYAIFVYNTTDWTDFYIWVWEEGSGGEDFLGVGWPGAPFTGTQMIKGNAYYYYDFGQMNNGKTVNVIVSNNGSPQSDTLSGLTLDKNYYFELSGTKLIEIDPDTFQPGGETPEEPEPGPTPEPGEYTIYIQNQTGWDDFFMYAWGASEIFGGWPGQQPAGTTEINGVTYMYYTVSGAGEEENLIFNNNTGTQYDAMVVTIDKDYYIIAYPDHAELAPDPVYHLYIDNQTGWSQFYVYAWGASEFFGGWPGQSSETVQEIDGVTYTVFEITGTGGDENLIFHNNEGTQYDAMTIVFDKDYYIVASPTGATVKE